MSALAALSRSSAAAHPAGTGAPRRQARRNSFGGMTLLNSVGRSSSGAGNAKQQVQGIFVLRTSWVVAGIAKRSTCIPPDEDSIRHETQV